jgi:hypothetical protein
LVFVFIELRNWLFLVLWRWNNWVLHILLESRRHLWCANQFCWVTNCFFRRDFLKGCLERDNATLPFDARNCAMLSSWSLFMSIPISSEACNFPLRSDSRSRYPTNKSFSCKPTYPCLP